MRFVRRAVAALAAASMLALVGCATGTEPIAEETEPGDGRAATTGTARQGTEGSSDRDGVAGGASCEPGAFLPVLKQFDDADAELVVDDVAVANCQNGYARVFAIPRENPTGHPQHENEQVFLRDVAGAWEVVESGTGISCGDSDLSSQLVEVCEGLGER